MEPESLRFPVLTIPADGTLDVVNDPSHFTIVNALAVRKGYFTGLKVVQQDGHAFLVTEIVPLGSGGPLFGLRFMKPRLIRARMRLEPSGRLTLTDVKREVIVAVRRNHEAWEAFGHEDTSSIEARIDAARDMNALFEIFV